MDTWHHNVVKSYITEHLGGAQCGKRKQGIQIKQTQDALTPYKTRKTKHPNAVNARTYEKTKKQEAKTHKTPVTP